jgi:hypothetical protein
MNSKGWNELVTEAVPIAVDDNACFMLRTDELCNSKNERERRCSASGKAREKFHAIVCKQCLEVRGITDGTSDSGLQN